VPEGKLESYHVYKHPIAKHMDVENNNYIIPRDGSIPIQVVDLDEILDDLKGSLGNFQQLSEAKKRIIEKIGEVSTS
jgi:hypothetical protein